MDFLVALVGKVVEFTVGPVGRQFSYVLSYHSNIRRLKESVELLQDKREDVDHWVVSARSNNKEIAREVCNWMCRVDEISKQVERLYEEESHANTGCSHRSCPNLWLRHQISRKAKQMSVRVDELRQSSISRAKISYRTLPQGVGLSLEDKEAFQSRISTMNEIMEAIADPAVHVVGLYGLGGVGKTTLTKQVAKKAEKEKLFEMVVWVEVKHNSIKEIQSQIAYKVGLQVDMQSESEIVAANRLCERMEKEKSLLVILDDLWKRFDLKQAGIPFADEGKKHCKIILTSRNEDLLISQMNCTRNVKVELLSEKEAWELFKKMSAIHDNFDDPDLLSVVTEVAQKCAQLPVAIVTVARALRNNKNSSKWSDALIQLKRHTSGNIPGVKDEVYSSIKLSYDYLESQELKSTFLLSANLSHDPLLIELFMYSVGLDFLEGVHYLKEARVRLHTLVHQLKASSLLLSSYSKYRFTMHDVVRDVALSIASEEKHALVKRHEKVDEWPDNDQLESCTAICLDNSDIDEIPEQLYCPKVEFFLLNSTNPDLGIPSNFFKGMEELKVLNLANMAFSSLPFSISLLKKLKTLSLHSCTLEDITIVEHLKKLKILNLSYSRIEQLPSEVAQLSCMQMLNLNCCSELKMIPPNILSNLKKLEELYMEGSFNQWDAQGQERASLAELQHLQKLSTLEINIPDASILPKDLFSENSLEMYRISIGTSRVHFSDYECPRKLTLKLDNNIDKVHGVFKLLESVQDLYLENLNGITSLCQLVMTPRTFRKLTAIKVRCCDQLESLFSGTMARTLDCLEKIEVFECKSIEQIVAFESKENVRESAWVGFPQLRCLTLNSLPALTSFCFNDKVIFPYLATLRLESINFQNIWQIPTSTSSGTQNPNISRQSPYHSFSFLKTLKVEMCDFLLKLIPLPLLKSLSNLEELWISSCLSLEVVFDFEELNDYTETRAMRLKILDIHKLPKLKTVWGKGSQKNFSFQYLQKVTASECQSLESIFPASVAKGLVQLEELEIKYCGIEVLVAKDESTLEADATFAFPKLTCIKLLDLPYLKNFYSQSHISEWPLLGRLEIKDCNELAIFQPELLDSRHTKYPLFLDEKVIPKLEVLTLDGRHAMLIWNDKFREYQFPNVKALYLSCISIYGKAPTFPYGLCYGFPNLKHLEVSFSSFEVIFSSPGHLHDVQNVAPFKKLRLYSLLQLKHIWNEKCQLDLVLHNLQGLQVFNCPSLLNLGPSFISLENLTDLEVNSCDRLMNLFTSQTARTLVQLTKLIIKGCSNIREIITNGREDLEKEIVFMNLKSLELFELTNWESFCFHKYSFIFPSLVEVTIRQCPIVRMFCPGPLTTPFLKSVKVENNEIHWPSNLNKTIEQLFAEKVAFTTNLKLHEYPELIDIWNGKLPIPYRSFCNLASLVVEKCDFLSNHVIPSYILISLINLKSLKVSNCDFVEVVFDLEGINIEEEAHKLQAMHLANLKLDRLPNLKHVWNNDAHRIDCFQHLEYVHAYECGSLRSIFPVSIAKGLTKLKKLEIESCGVEVIVAEDQTLVEAINFVFPQLCFLGLIKLPNLKNFHPQRHTIEWPQLKRMDVRLCKNVKVFSLEVPNTTDTHAKDDGVENQYPLFLLDKVVTKFESLVLNQNDVRILRNGQFQDELFQEVWFLGLDSFDDDEEPLVFPYAFLERFPNLFELTVGNSSFKEIFPSQGPSKQVPLFKELTLTHLYHLQNVWNENSQIHPGLQYLERLDVNHCFRLINLAPSSASFDNLKWLTVFGCHSLGYLLTSSTAKSLVRLQVLMIQDCKIIEEIIKSGGEDMEEKIALKFLNSIELIDLPILKSFCTQTHTFEFPSLDEVTVKGCLKMKMFCPGDLLTPLLEGMTIEENEKRWEENLNKTLEQLFSEKEC